MQVLTEVKLRKVIREEIKTNHGHLSLREQRQLEEQVLNELLAGLKAVAGKIGQGIKSGAKAAGGAALQGLERLGDVLGPQIDKAAEMVGKQLQNMKDTYNVAELPNMKKELQKMDVNLKALSDNLKKAMTARGQLEQKIKATEKLANSQKSGSTPTASTEPAATARAVPTTPAPAGAAAPAPAELEEARKRHVKKITESVVRKLRTLEKKKARKRSS